MQIVDLEHLASSFRLAQKKTPRVILACHINRWGIRALLSDKEHFIKMSYVGNSWYKRFPQGLIQEVNKSSDQYDHITELKKSVICFFVLSAGLKSSHPGRLKCSWLILLMKIFIAETFKWSHWPLFHHLKRIKILQNFKKGNISE